jgi:hypothetical protein
VLFFHRQNSSAFAGNEFHRKGYNGIDAFSFIRAGVSVDMGAEMSTYMFEGWGKCRHEK